MKKRRQIGPKEGNWVYNPDRAGFKMEIPGRMLGVFEVKKEIRVQISFG